jgi:hypothetical protein
MRSLHGLAKTHASFDDPNLVSRAGLVPVMALAQRAGLAGLVAEHVRPGGPCGVNAELKVPCLVAGMYYSCCFPVCDRAAAQRGT